MALIVDGRSTLWAKALAVGLMIAIRGVVRVGTLLTSSGTLVLAMLALDGALC